MMMKRRKSVNVMKLFLSLSVAFSIVCVSEGLLAEEAIAAPSTPKLAPKEEVVTTSHSVKINGVETPYKATTGTQVLTDEKNQPKASIFYIAYTKEPFSGSKRPITFCFNGGPGSSSVWLHLGVFGPRRVAIDPEGKVALQPYHLVDNAYSLLEETDLVFIDPVSTGYSRAVDDPKAYHGVDSDVQSVAEFIRLYITRNERWESPKFIAGESYGTTRAAALTQELHDTHYIYMDGIVLVSTVLNFQTIGFTGANDLPYILFLPSYTTTALYHKKLSQDLQDNPKRTVAEVEQFALGDYARALMLGNKIDAELRKSVVERLARYTGLSESYIDRSNLRVPMFRFGKELLRSERRTIGRFDGRLKGIDMDTCGESFSFDSSYENIVGLFAATFNTYVRAELEFKRDEEYKILTNVQPWDYTGATNQYLDVADKLKDVMSKNTTLEVFVGSGYTDLATPYFATEYTFNHLDLDPSIEGNVVLKNYEGGHMMYLYEPSLIALKNDISQFYRNRLSKKAN